jgi:hypothetical protein
MTRQNTSDIRRECAFDGLRERRSGNTGLRARKQENAAISSGSWRRTGRTGKIGFTVRALFVGSDRERDSIILPRNGAATARTSMQFRLQLMPKQSQLGALFYRVRNFHHGQNRLRPSRPLYSSNEPRFAPMTNRVKRPMFAAYV